MALRLSPLRAFYRRHWLSPSDPKLYSRFQIDGALSQNELGRRGERRMKITNFPRSDRKKKSLTFFFSSSYFSYHSVLLCLMGCRFISREIKEKALELSLRGVADATIRDCLGISQCTLRRLRQKYRQTGEVVQVPLCPGRPRLLDGLDVRVCLFSFNICFSANEVSSLRAAYSASRT